MWDISDFFCGKLCFFKKNPLNKLKEEKAVGEMLNVQEYLRSNRDLSNLCDEFGIKAREHEEFPLVILNYNQIESPKTHPIVRECRGLVLEKGTWNIVAKSFDRFFNLGEDLENSKKFDWGCFDVTEKMDGSLIIVFYYGGKWHINTRGTFGYTDNVNFTGKTWDEYIRPLLKDKFDLMSKNYTYVFEFVSIFNKIVRVYAEMDVYLIGAFVKDDSDVFVELVGDKLKEHVLCVGLKQVKSLNLKSLNQVQEYLEWLEENDPTNEGVVVRDRNGMRLKIKSKTYLSLHRMYNNDGPSPKNLLSFVLSGEKDELLSYFPEYAEEYEKVESVVEEAKNKLIDVWEKT